MKPVTITILSVVIAVAGTWSKKSTIQVPMVVGGMMVTLAIVAMDEAQPELAKSFAWLLLASTVGAFGEDVFTSVGNITTGKSGQATAQTEPNGGRK